MAEPAVTRYKTPSISDLMDLILKQAEDNTKLLKEFREETKKIMAWSRIELQSETSKFKKELNLNMHGSI